MIAHKLCKANSKFRISVEESQAGTAYRSKEVRNKILEVSGCQLNDLSTLSKMIKYLHSNMDIQLKGLN